MTRALQCTGKMGVPYVVTFTKEIECSMTKVLPSYQPMLLDQASNLCNTEVCGMAPLG
jgi:hypothetical protein